MQEAWTRELTQMTAKDIVLSVARRPRAGGHGSNSVVLGPDAALPTDAALRMNLAVPMRPNFTGLSPNLSRFLELASLCWKDNPYRRPSSNEVRGSFNRHILAMKELANNNVYCFYMKKFFPSCKQWT